MSQDIIPAGSEDENLLNEAGQLVTNDHFADDVELVERFQALEPGTYWRAEQDYSFKSPERSWSYDVEKGTVLLLVEIEDYDGKPHTVSILQHPQHGSYQYKALVQDFLNAFTPSYDADEVRARELGQIQQQLQKLQTELIESNQNPELMKESVDAELRQLEQKFIHEDRREQGGIPVDQVKVTPPALPGGNFATSVSSAISSRLSADDVKGMRRFAERESAIAQGRVNWMNRQTGKINDTLQKMTPFIKEKAAVAMAKASGAIAFADKVSQGIQSLDLYTGKGVDVVTLVDGQEASPDEKLHIFQRKLIVAEELAVFQDVGEMFDISNQSDFDAALAAHPEFLDQLIPAQRGVVSLALCRRDIDYGNTWLNKVMNEQNQRVFLLVRNGQKVHKVYSSIESHEHAKRLFPYTDELNNVFRGMDGDRIDFDSLKFTEKASNAERVALHYKRFLILMCGLDHRLNLFGRFYEESQSLSFISLPFQERNMVFVRDDEMGFMLGEGKPDVFEYIKEMNKGLQSGSRVFCYHYNLLSPDTAPAVMRKKSSGSHEFVDTYAEPVNAAEELIAYKDGHSIAVDVQVKRTTYGESRGSIFNAKVNLTVASKGFLCLDRVSPEDLEYYIYNREARVEHIGYLRNFKRIAAFLKMEREDEAEARKYLTTSIIDAGLASKDAAAGLVEDSVVAWRCVNRGAPLPRVSDKATLNKILTHTYTLLKSNDSLAERAAEYAQQLGLNPLRVSLTGRSRLVLYVETPVEERDETFMEWGWVRRISLDVLKTKLSETSSRHFWLSQKPDPKETVLKEWSDIDNWIHDRDEPLNPSVFNEMRQVLDDAADTLALIGSIGKGGGLPVNLFYKLMDDIEREMFEKAGKYVGRCVVDFPIAAMIERNQGKSQPVFLTIKTHGHQLINEFGNAQQKQAMLDRFLRGFQSPEKARQLSREGAVYVASSVAGRMSFKHYWVNRERDGWTDLMSAAMRKLNEEWKPGEKPYRSDDQRSFDGVVAELVKMAAGEVPVYQPEDFYVVRERKVNPNTKSHVSPKLFDEHGVPVLEKWLDIKDNPSSTAKLRF